MVVQTTLIWARGTHQNAVARALRERATDEGCGGREMRQDVRTVVVRYRYMHGTQGDGGRKGGRIFYDGDDVRDPKTGQQLRVYGGGKTS